MHAVMRIRFDAPEDAGRAHAALAPDDPGMLVIRVEGNDLVLEATGEAPRTLLRTLDDALGCLRATGIP